MRCTGLDDSPAGIKIARRNSNTSHMQLKPLMAESKEEIKILSMKVKKGEKTGLNSLGCFFFFFGWRKSFPYLGERIFMDSSCPEEQLPTKASVSPYLIIVVTKKPETTFPSIPHIGNSM